MANAQRSSGHDDARDGATVELEPSTVLFLASNPALVPALELGEECRAIEEKIRAARFRDQIRFRSRWAARPDDLLQALNEEAPSVLHFSGHGFGDHGLCFQAKDGSALQVGADGLAQVIRAVGASVMVVVLNACYSEVQAQALVAQVPCVVGMPDAIGDAAAITYAASFYRALAFGKSVANAHEQGLAALALHRTSGQTRDVQGAEAAPRAPTPTLLSRPDIDADLVYIVRPPPDDNTSVREDLGTTSRPRRRRTSRRLVVLLFLVAVSAAAWVANSGDDPPSLPPSAFSVVVWLHGPASLLDLVCTSGTVTLDIGTDRRSENISNDGGAYFTEIPPSLINESVPIRVSCQGYEADDVSARITLERDRKYYVSMHGHCGNQHCDSGETPQSCAGDCPAVSRDAGADAAVGVDATVGVDAAVRLDAAVSHPAARRGPCTRTLGTLLHSASSRCPKLKSSEPDARVIAREAEEEGYTCTDIYRCR